MIFLHFEENQQVPPLIVIRPSRWSEKLQGSQVLTNTKWAEHVEEPDDADVFLQKNSRLTSNHGKKNYVRTGSEATQKIFLPEKLRLQFRRKPGETHYGNRSRATTFRMASYPFEASSQIIMQIPKAIKNEAQLTVEWTTDWVWKINELR